MLQYVAERANRLHKICGKIEHNPRFGLMAEYKLSDAQYSTLRNYLALYLYDSVVQLNQGLYVLTDDFLTDYAGCISKLPNITPNGLLLPKRHNLLSYNMVYRYITSLVKSFGIEEHMAKIHSPINVRIVNGEPNHAIDNRPRSSVKLHSDIWAGEFTNHIMIFIPVFGDMVHNGVELFEPGADFYPSFVRPLADYSEGSGLLADSTKYDVTMNAGSIYFLDSFLLHRTMKTTPGLRLVLNFAFLTKEKVASDLEIETARGDEYVDPDFWFGFGRDRIVTTKTEARAFTVGETAVAKNAYADKYETLEL